MLVLFHPLQVPSVPYLSFVSATSASAGLFSCIENPEAHVPPDLEISQYRRSISADPKIQYPGRACSVQPRTGRNWTCKTRCLHHQAALCKVVRQVFGWPFSSKRDKQEASFLEVLCKSIQCFSPNAARRPQVGDFEWHLLRLGWFSYWLEKLKDGCSNKMNPW